VEFALVLPMALVVLTFIFAVGVYCTQSLDLTNATSISGQYMILLRGTTLATDPCKTFVQTFEATAPIFNTSNLTFNFTLNGTNYSNVTTCTAGAAGLTQGATATFSVSYPCSLGIYGAQLAPGCTLKSQVTEIIQ
jgi:Flp pilus assembly protein TadG